MLLQGKSLSQYLLRMKFVSPQLVSKYHKYLDKRDHSNTEVGVNLRLTQTYLFSTLEVKQKISIHYAEVKSSLNLFL